MGSVVARSKSVRSICPEGTFIFTSPMQPGLRILFQSDGKVVKPDWESVRGGRFEPEYEIDWHIAPGTYYLLTLRKFKKEIHIEELIVNNGGGHLDGRMIELTGIPPNIYLDILRFLAM